MLHQADDFQIIERMNADGSRPHIVVPSPGERFLRIYAKLVKTYLTRTRNTVLATGFAIEQRH